MGGEKKTKQTRKETPHNKTQQQISDTIVHHSHQQPLQPKPEGTKKPGTRAWWAYPSPMDPDSRSYIVSRLLESPIGVLKTEANGAKKDSPMTSLKFLFLRKLRANPTRREVRLSCWGCWVSSRWPPSTTQLASRAHDGHCPLTGDFHLVRTSKMLQW